MAAAIDIRHLRAVTPAEQANTLRTAKGDVQAITETLLDGIAKGILPPPVIQSWLGVARSPVVAVQTFHQRDSAVARRIALKYITRYLRRASTFQVTWDALGGSAGLAKTMTELSVRQLRDLCDALANTANAGEMIQDEVRAHRQKAITELFHLLQDKDRNKTEERPVDVIYYRLLPACTPETALEWAAKLDGDDFKWISHSRTDIYSKGLRRKMTYGNWPSFAQQAFQREVEAKEGSVDLQKLEPYMKASLSFAIRVLEKVSESSDLRGVDPDDWILDLTIPIVRRCAKHRANVDRHNHVWDIIISALQKHPSLGENLHEAPESGMDNDKTLIDWAVVSFHPGPRRPHDEERLSTFFSLIPKNMMSDKYLQNLLDLARPHHKYHFLRLLLLNAPAFKVDIGEASSTEPLTFEGIHFPHTVFTYLPPLEGLTLFERCLAANPNLSFVYRSPYLRDHIVRYGLDRGNSATFDVHILRALLINRVRNDKIILPKDPEAVLEDLRTTELGERKKNAAKGRDTDIRSFWAMSALRLAIAMNDCDVVADTLIWARRFNKDPLTVKKLHETDILEMQETIDMVCVLPESPAKVDALEERIRKANRVLLILNETAIMALREPSVKASDWTSVYNLIDRAIERRIERLSTLQNAMGIDDEALFNTVLRPTIDTVIEIEALLLKPEHNKLYQPNPSGLLGNMHLAGLKGQVGASAVRFLDTLAKERNHIWEKQRSQEHPILMTVGKPWPRGLPVQNLLPPELQNIAGVAKASYVQERAEAVVFCDPEIALAPIPEDSEVQLAVNPFFDSWPSALKLWLLASNGEDDRQARINRAWEYALGPLTNGRMNGQQAQKFWAEQGFSSVVEGVTGKVEAWQDRYLADLPDPSEADGPVEWDPDPAFHASIVTARAHRLETVACIDCMLTHARKPHNSETMFDMYQLEAPLIKKSGPVWPDHIPRLRKRLWTTGSFKGSTIDAYITTSLLCVNSRLGSDSSVFMRPYPSENEPRFPAVYLEESFLARNQDENGGQESRTLQSLLPWIPAELLAQVATSVLDRMAANDTTSHWSFVELIKLLCRSDKPALAAPLIQRFIVNNVEASAWHRELLNPTFLTYLDPKSAEDFFASLANAILARLKEQKSRKPEPSKEQTVEKQPSPPLVKVTTIKMVAQLLKQSEFLRPRVSLDILKQLASESTHIDVRAAAFESLLKSPVSGELKETIYDIIEELAIPIAGALNEAHPETEEDWQAAENGGPLPEVKNDMLNHPVLGLLLSRSNSGNWPVIGLTRKALRVSAENNARWTKLFLKKHGFDLGGIELPAIPSLYRGSVRLFELMDPTDIPVEEFEVMRRHVLLLSNPPEPLAATTKAMIESADVASSSGGKHWIEMWRISDNFPSLLGANWIGEALADFPYFEKKVSYETVTEEMLEGVLLEIMNIHLSKGHTPRFLYNTRILSPNFDNKSGIPDESRGGGKLIRQLINRIDTLRTPEWQRDPNRQPPYLPDTFRLHFALLHAPSTANTAAARVHLPGYVDRVVSLVEYVVKNDAMYHKNFDMISKSVRQVRNWKLYHAYLLGSPSRFSNPENPTLVDHLRVEMSLSLFDDIKAVGAQEKGDAKLVLGMLDDWAASPVEYLRMQAFNVRHTYRVTKRYRGPGERDWVNKGVD